MPLKDTEKDERIEGMCVEYVFQGHLEMKNEADRTAHLWWKTALLLSRSQTSTAHCQLASALNIGFILLSFFLCR